MAGFDYELLAEAGLAFIRIEYSGSNDEGWINSIYAVSGPESEERLEDVELADGLYRQLENDAYGVLEQHHAGWEINEGSEGHFLLDVKARKAMLHHGENYQQTTWTEAEV